MNTPYYHVNDSVFAMNTTSQLWVSSAEIATIEHGCSTSRIHYKIYSAFDNTISLESAFMEMIID